MNNYHHHKSGKYFINKQAHQHAKPDSLTTGLCCVSLPFCFACDGDNRNVVSADADVNAIFVVCLCITYPKKCFPCKGGRRNKNKDLLTPSLFGRIRIWVLDREAFLWSMNNPQCTQNNYKYVHRITFSSNNRNKRSKLFSRLISHPFDQMKPHMFTLNTYIVHGVCSYIGILQTADPFEKDTCIEEIQVCWWN